MTAAVANNASIATFVANRFRLGHCDCDVRNRVRLSIKR